MAQHTNPTENQLKQAAKARKRLVPGLTHTKALDLVAQEYGFDDYAGFLESRGVKLQRLRKASSASLQEDILRQFRVAMTKRGINYSLFIPTATGLKKSILDATGQVRLHFESEAFHDYAKQGKGPLNRVRKQAFFVTVGVAEPTTVSLYRPETKKGDPRMWFRGLGKFAQPNDVVAIVFHAGEPYLINLSELSSTGIATRLANGRLVPESFDIRKNHEIELTDCGGSAALASVHKPVIAEVKVDLEVREAGPVMASSYWSQPQSPSATNVATARRGGDQVHAERRIGLELTVVKPEEAPKLNLTPLADFLESLVAKRDEVSQKLLRELRSIAAAGPIRARSVGDTAVGMAVEHALKIAPNCRREPDYGGQIELKAARTREPGRQTRQTLFAQVPDWGRAETVMKSSAEILQRFGYERGDDFKLYCTVSPQPNSQGLFLEVSDDDEFVQEVHEEFGVVAVWPASLLLRRLLQKHGETFWIKADSVMDKDGVEWFMLRSVVHTKKPLAGQLLPLIRDGHITMDHLIKQKPTGEVSEKGPLFKISPEGFNYLFPEPKEYFFA